MRTFVKLAGVFNLIAGVYSTTIGVLSFVAESGSSNPPRVYGLASALMTAAVFVAAGVWLLRGRKFSGVSAALYALLMAVLAMQIGTGEGAQTLAHLAGLAAVVLYTAVAYFILSRPLELLPKPGAAGGISVSTEAAREHMRGIPPRPAHPPKVE